MSLGLTAIVLNTETMALSGYTNYGFKGMSVVGGVLYGIKDDGLYRLTGEDDNGDNIDSEFLTGETDLDQDRLKVVNMVHVDGTGSFKVLVEINDTVNELTYNNRARAGRGARGNRLAFGLRSIDGSRLKVNALEIDIDLHRKRAI